MLPWFLGASKPILRYLDMSSRKVCNSCKCCNLFVDPGKPLQGVPEACVINKLLLWVFLQPQQAITFYLSCKICFNILYLDIVCYNSLFFQHYTNVCTYFSKNNNNKNFYCNGDTNLTTGK